MKRIAKKSSLLKKQRVRSVHRKVETIGSTGNGFYGEITKRSGKARICVARKLGGIGDVLMTLPAVLELKKRFPESHITYACDRHTTVNDVYYALLKNVPFIDAIADGRYVNPNDFDAYVDISAVCIPYERADLPPINRIDLFARRMGLDRLRDKLPFYKVEDHEKAYAQHVLAQLDPQKNRIVALHTASFEEKRSWPIQKYIEMIDRTIREGRNIRYVVFDFNGKYSRWSNYYPYVINCSQTNLREMAAIIDACDLFIGPDSGPMHVAGAVQTPSLVMFGSIPPEARINHYSTHRAIVLDGLKCLGCWYADCPIGVKCMKDLTSDTVFGRMINMLRI